MCIIVPILFWGSESKLCQKTYIGKPNAIGTDYPRVTKQEEMRDIVMDNWMLNECDFNAEVNK